MGSAPASKPCLVRFLRSRRMRSSTSGRTARAFVWGRRRALGRIPPAQLLDPLSGDVVVAGDLAFAASFNHHRSDDELRLRHPQSRCQLCRETAASYVPETRQRRTLGRRTLGRRTLGRFAVGHPLTQCSAGAACARAANQPTQRPSIRYIRRVDGCGPTRPRDIRDRTLPDLDHLGRKILASMSPKPLREPVRAGHGVPTPPRRHGRPKM